MAIRKPQIIYCKNEKKAIGFVAKILKTKKVECQKTFDWLRGDKTKNRLKGTCLRVDAYFSEKNLVVEYHGSQHFFRNNLMDRRPGRAKQRRRYTELRRKLIPMHGLKLLEIAYNEPLEEGYLAKKIKDTM
jgi:hypothetical protein